MGVRALVEQSCSSLNEREREKEKEKEKVREREREREKEREVVLRFEGRNN